MIMNFIVHPFTAIPSLRQFKVVCFVLFFAIGVAGKAQAQCASFYQVFESFVTNNTAANLTQGTATGGPWTVNSVGNTATGYSGVKSIIFTALTSYIITPKIDTPKVVSFYYKKLNSSGTGMALKVEYATSTSGPWTAFTGNTVTSTDNVNWTNFSVDFSNTTLFPVTPTGIYIKISDNRTAAGLTSVANIDDVSWTSTNAAENTQIVLPNTTATTNCTTVALAADGVYTFYDNGGLDDTFNTGQNQTTTFTPASGQQIELTIVAYNATAGALTISNADNILTGYTGATLPTQTVYTSSQPSGVVTVQYTTTGTATTGFIITVKSKPPVATCGNVSSASVTAGSITYQGATLGWVCPTTPSVGFDYYVATLNTTPGSGPITPSSSSTLQVGTLADGTLTSNAFTGLAGDSTVFYAWIRTNCGGLLGSWVYAGTFTTLCSPVNVTYTENFNALNGPLPFCTSAVKSNNTPSSSWGTNLTNGNLYTNELNSMFLTKPVNLTAGVTYRITYDYYSNNGSTDFKVWIGMTTGVPNYSNITTLLFTHTGATTLQSSLLHFTPATTGIYYLGFSTEAFQNSGSTILNLDNVVIDIENCFVPTLSPTVTAVGSSSGTISWTPPTPSPASGYQYYISTSSTSPQYGTTPSGNIAAGLSTYTLSGLTSGITYFVWIRSSCGSGEYSEWSSLATFTTLNVYCVSTATVATTYFNSFATTGGITNVSNTSSGFSASGYGNFMASQIVTQTQTGSVSFSTNITNVAGGVGVGIFVDWNQNGVFTDPGESVYNTNGIDVFANPTGSFTVPVTALVGATRMRIVVNLNASTPVSCNTGITGETEDYTFVVTTLPCSGFPSAIGVVIVSSTSATASWTAASPAPANGYQYYLSTSNSTPTTATTPTGSTAAGVTTVTFTGLSSSTNYYLWVRSNCGGALGQGGWVGVTSFFQPNCTIGNGTGVTTQECPSVVSGGLGLSGADPAPISGCTAGGCVNLEATYLQLNQTTNYTVQNIPYAPPYQFKCLQNPVNVSVDDIWSQTINLPFNFCYYGTNYNKCLISSNGVLTFDTTTYAPGGFSNWSFASNLPSSSLFLNSIFGVYHDIDPSKGGQIGWELITLNTGCRALVASWSDIPMYSTSCNSILYTGMIVLYENTNVIEVYIKDKSVCSTWNSGNAIVGLQNATGTQAVVAPNRNGLDSDWTVSNEAWRFVPSGPSITTVKWFEGSGTTGTVVGTTPVISVCPTATTTYTAEVTYALCSGTTLKEVDMTSVVVSGSKQWNGSVDSDWNKTANWTPAALPTLTDCVNVPVTAHNPVIAEVVSGTPYCAQAGTVSVYNGAQLTVSSGNNLTVTDWISVQPTASLIVQNNANLVQITNVATNLNTGSITYQRDASIRNLDYVYWSSPVAGFDVASIASPIVSGPIYKWNTTVANTNGGWGNWEAASGIMTAGKGYIVRGPDSFSSSFNTLLHGQFIGVPNNGTVTFPIARGTDQNTAFHTGINGTEINNFSDNWNLLGNPYPSSIRGSQFLFDNSNKIEGQIRLWTHGTLPAIIPSPFYGTYVYNYTPGDYYTYNFTGTSCCPAAASDLFIGGGQGFFVIMKDGAAGSNTVSFTNSLRSDTYSNSMFYKASTISANPVNSLERNRIWLDVLSEDLDTDRTLVGYVEGATMQRDSFFDAGTLPTGELAIYSIIGHDKYVIQGRALPFNAADVVPIGLTIPKRGNYTIAIAAVDGLFELNNLPIYIEDTQTGIVQNLRTAPFVVHLSAGTYANRFKLRYKYAHKPNYFNKAEEAGIIVSAHDKQLQIQSSEEAIQSVVVYDVLGRTLLEVDSIENYEYVSQIVGATQAALIVKVTLVDGTTTTQKILL
jgi:hypothetical protein